MLELSEEQLKHLNKDALVIIAASLQNQLRSMAHQLENANVRLDDNNRQIELLTEQIRLMNQRHLGKKAESGLNDMEGQLTLFDSFNEAEGFQKKDLAEPTIEEVTISSYRRSKTKGKREADLDGLPARIFEHRLSDEELDEKFPNGYKELPVEIHKRLHIIPETFIVDEHHVHVYASKSNDGTIIRAERPLDLFRNSIATPALVASIINGKYANTLPPERQSRAYKCNGINLSTNTMSNWVINSTDRYLSLVYERLHELIYENKVIHARCPFADFIKSVGLKTAKGTVAQEAYDMITDILHTDNEFDDLSNTDRRKQRQTKLQEKVDAYFEWVKQKYSQVTHNSTIGKALAYSINQEKYLRVFLTDGMVPPDNNYAEQAIRPFTIGRKNFVLMESDNGAKASAMLYSLVETAKANEVNTYQYLELLLTEIPKHMDDNNLKFLDELLPWSPRVQKECPSRYKKK